MLKRKKQVKRIDFDDDEDLEEYIEEDLEQEQGQIKKAVSQEENKIAPLINLSELLDIVQGNLVRSNQLLSHLRKNQGI
jgi:hypothetical protein